MSLNIYVGGPGIGETIIIDIEKKATIVIDCPLFNKKPLARYILDKIKRNTIDLLVLTHTHADHINGAAQLIDQFPPSSVISFHYMASTYWATLKNINDNKNIPFSEELKKNYTQFEKLVEKLKKLNHSLSSNNFFRASHGQLIEPDFIKKLNNNGCPIKIKVISPTPKIIDPFIESALTKNNPFYFTELPRNENKHANYFCSTLKMKYGKNWLYFTSDAISEEIENFCSDFPETVCFYKVSHHGSKNGNPSYFWKTVGHKIQNAVVTHFSGRLPEERILEEIKKSGPTLSLTPKIVNKKKSSKITSKSSLLSHEIYSNFNEEKPEFLRFSFNKDGTSLPPVPVKI